MPKEAYETIDCSDTELGELVDSYLEHCKERNYKPNGLMAKKRDLELLLTMLGEADEKLSLTILNNKSLIRVFQKLAEKGYSPATIERFFYTLQTFIQFILKVDPSGIREGFPAAGIQIAKKEPPAIHTISQEDEARLYKVIKKTAKFPLRDRSIIMLMLEYGLRVREVVNLNTGDHDGRKANICAAKTTTRERIVNLGSSNNSLLKRYEDEERAGKRPENRDALFLGERGPLTENAVQKNLRVFGRKVGLRVDPSTLRYTAGLKRLKRTDSVQDAADFLGVEINNLRLNALAQLAGID